MNLIESGQFRDSQISCRNQSVLEKDWRHSFRIDKSRADSTGSFELEPNLNLRILRLMSEMTPNEPLVLYRWLCICLLPRRAFVTRNFMKSLKGRYMWTGDRLFVFSANSELMVYTR